MNWALADTECEDPAGFSTDHILYDILPSILLWLDRAIQLAQYKHTQLLTLQQTSDSLHVQPANTLPIKNIVYHLLQELLVLTGTFKRKQAKKLVTLCLLWLTQEESYGQGTHRSTFPINSRSHLTLSVANVTAPSSSSVFHRYQILYFAFYFL